jgi:hypothetical protein
VERIRGELSGLEDRVSLKDRSWTVEIIRGEFSGLENRESL